MAFCSENFICPCFKDCLVQNSDVSSQKLRFIPINVFQKYYMAFFAINILSSILSYLKCYLTKIVRHNGIYCGPDVGKPHRQTQVFILIAKPKCCHLWQWEVSETFSCLKVDTILTFWGWDIERGRNLFGKWDTWKDYFPKEKDKVEIFKKWELLKQDHTKAHN